MAHVVGRCLGICQWSFPDERTVFLNLALEISSELPLRCKCGYKILHRNVAYSFRYKLRQPLFNNLAWQKNGAEKSTSLKIKVRPVIQRRHYTRSRIISKIFLASQPCALNPTTRKFLVFKEEWGRGSHHTPYIVSI